MHEIVEKDAINNIIGVDTKDLISILLPYINFSAAQTSRKYCIVASFLLHKPAEGGKVFWVVFDETPRQLGAHFHAAAVATAVAGNTAVFSGAGARII